MSVYFLPFGRHRKNRRGLAFGTSGDNACAMMAMATLASCTACSRFSRILGPVAWIVLSRPTSIQPQTPPVSNTRISGCFGNGLLWLVQDEGYIAKEARCKFGAVPLLDLFKLERGAADREFINAHEVCEPDLPRLLADPLPKLGPRRVLGLPSWFGRWFNRAIFLRGCTNYPFFTPIRG